MQVNDEYIDELFARKLGSVEATPPEDGWHRLENELNRRSRNTRRFWLAAASIALILGVAASVVYLQTNGNTTGTEIIASNDQVLVQNESAQQLISDKSETNKPVAEQIITSNSGSSSQETDQALTESIQSRQNRQTIRPDKTISPAQAVQSQSTSHQPEVIVAESLPSATLYGTNRQTITMPKQENQPSSISLTLPELNNAPSKDLTYTDSWNEATREQLLKMKRLEFMAGKITKAPDLHLKEPTAPTSVPVYDDYAFIDIAETAVKPDKAKNKWEISGQFAPMYSYRVITSMPNNLNKGDFDDAESALLAYSGGVKVAYQVVPRLSVQTGVYYTQMGQTIDKISRVYNMYAAISTNNAYAKNFVRTSTGNVTVVSGLKADANTNYANYFNEEGVQTKSSAVVNTMSNATTSENTKYQLIERLDYIEIPVLLRYKIIDRKLNFYLLGGMSTNILIDNNVFIDNGSNLTKDGIILMARPVNYSSSLGLGLSYPITRNLLFDIEPSFKYFLRSYSTNSNDISTNPYSFGLYTGIIYRF